MAFLRICIIVHPYFLYHGQMRRAITVGLMESDSYLLQKGREMSAVLMQ